MERSTSLDHGFPGEGWLNQNAVVSHHGCGHPMRDGVVELGPEEEATGSRDGITSSTVNDWIRT
ncbi:MAG: hypothetical protein VX589_20805 [Myxococcota bacterium]|nr:hypothetical protein [Myxococcota bacterium]